MTQGNGQKAIVENGVTIGVIDFGMFFIQPDPSLTFDAIFHRLTARYPDAFAEDCREEMLEAYNNTCSMSEEQFRCYITLVRCAARGMYLNTLFSAGDNTPTSRLRNYTRLLQPERIPLSSFSVASVAEELNFSQAHLARLSNEVFGMPLKQHILQMKIDYAKKLLLKEPNLSVRDIAQKVGIDNPHYLSRIFRQKTGYTCQEYRSVMTAQKKGSPE